MRTRVANACDVCKNRKVKCNGLSPCGYCLRRQRPQHCHYSPQQRRRARASRADAGASLGQHPDSPPSSVHSIAATGSAQRRHASSLSSHPTPAPSQVASGTELTPAFNRSLTAPAAHAHSLGPPGPSPHSHGDDGDVSMTVAVSEEHEETEVPREARLLCDAQGKLIFIGDSAPLSFFQTVRQLVTSRVDANAFAPQTSRYTVLENAHSRNPVSFGSVSDPPPVASGSVDDAIVEYLAVTAGLVDLFDHSRLLQDMLMWAGQEKEASASHADEMAPFVNYLVMAIGCQKSDPETAQAHFDYARDHAFANLNGNLSVGTVQAFILITVFMLGSCQINGAFLFFGIAVRAAYSIGIHRTEVNARFGHDMHRQRDRLWKSLRVVDLFLSTSMGRPPSTSDVDCTIPYREVPADEDRAEEFDLLNASAQIFLIIEGIVLEVYSRRKISLQLTEGISRELRDWSTRWLPQLKGAISKDEARSDPGRLNGACQVLATYYYAVILVSRPFLMYELHRRLADSYPPASFGPGSLVSGKSKLADACIDAASLMVDPVQDLIKRGLMTPRAPAIV
jgi:hypothetical protein